MKGRSVLRFRMIPFRTLPLLVALLAVLTAASPASANEKYAGIVVDGKTGAVLYAENADAKRYPASLTKIMTLYILFEELQAGRVSLNTQFSVSKNAAAQPPSKVGVRAGSTIKVEDAIQALTTKSANDVAVVIAENVEGSVSAFAARMNRAARALGMTRTTFRNPHGLPDSGQTTTASDLVKLARAVQDRFPTYYRYFSVRSFNYKGTTYRNHNKLLGSVRGVDGIKTGYIRASGFNLVTNVRDDGRHIIAVVMGGRTGASRDAQMRELIAEYLPKASRGGRTVPLLLASSGDVGLVETARLPKPRPARETDTATAQVAIAEAAPGTVATPATVAAAEPQVALAPPPSPARQAPTSAAEPSVVNDLIAARISAANEVAELAYAAPIGPRQDDPIAKLMELAQIRAGSQDMIAVAPAPAAPAGIVEVEEVGSAEGGWIIQIGAVPTVAGAQALLERARESVGSELASADPFTQRIEKDGTTLYRARFAGFAGKDEARATCAKLKSRSISCLAVPNG